MSVTWELIIIINEKFILRGKLRSKLRGAGHCTLVKSKTSVLRHIAEEFPPAARQWKILNFHRVINIALVTNIMMIADVGLPDAV